MFGVCEEGECLGCGTGRLRSLLGAEGWGFWGDPGGAGGWGVGGCLAMGMTGAVLWGHQAYGALEGSGV